MGCAASPTRPRAPRATSSPTTSAPGCPARERERAATRALLNASKVEYLVIEEDRERILTEEAITELMALVAEEIDNLAG